MPKPTLTAEHRLREHLKMFADTIVKLQKRYVIAVHQAAAHRRGPRLALRREP